MSREIGYARALQILDDLNLWMARFQRSIIEHNGASKPCYTPDMDFSA